MVGEVIVCVLSAVYINSWPFSLGAPQETYGCNLFKFLSWVKKKKNGPWEFRAGNQSERLGFVGGVKFAGAPGIRISVRNGF